MIKEIIPPELLMIGQPVAINVLKYCAEHGIEKGFTPIAPMTMTVDRKTVTYQEAMGIIVTNETEIILSQFE
jgi:hypothetical protein